LFHPAQAGAYVAPNGQEQKQFQRRHLRGAGGVAPKEKEEKRKRIKEKREKKKKRREL